MKASDLRVGDTVKAIQAYKCMREGEKGLVRAIDPSGYALLYIASVSREEWVNVFVLAFESRDPLYEAQQVRLNDLQEQVGKWHIDTFGALGTNEKICKKLSEETAEFIAESSGHEAADAVTCYLAWCARNNVNLAHELLQRIEALKSRDQLARDVERGIYTPEEVEAHHERISGI